MIEPLPDLLGGVIGFKFSGPVSRAEYVDVLLPDMQRALEAGGVRLAILIDDDFGWFNAGAFWEDLKFGLAQRVRTPTFVGANGNRVRRRLGCAMPWRCSVGWCPERPDPFAGRFTSKG
jgi:hypothetical protein